MRSLIQAYIAVWMAGDDIVSLPQPRSLYA